MQFCSSALAGQRPIQAFKDIQYIAGYILCLPKRSTFLDKGSCARSINCTNVCKSVPVLPWLSASSYERLRLRAYRDGFPS